MDFKRLREFASLYNLNLSSAQISQYETFADMLVEKNKVMNLTAIDDPDQIEIKHMIDSLEGLRVIKEIAPENFSLLDIGCGAGFPGLPLKIACPENRFVLLDSLRKRINFVNEVISELNLNNISAVSMRAEDFKEKDSFDIATSRAVAEMRVLLEYCMPFVKIGGYCIFYKSGEILEEIEQASAAINELGGIFLKTYTFDLPKNTGSRSLVVVKKVSETPDKYPRRAGKPSKNPIK